MKSQYIANFKTDKISNALRINTIFNTEVRTVSSVREVDKFY